MIIAFRNQYRFLSNFWPAPVLYGQFEFPTVEHAYQAAKSLDRNDHAYLANMNISAGKAKHFGRLIDIRPDWERMKLGIMEDLVRQKFFKHESLRGALLATGNATIVEGNTWGDTFWGVCGTEGQNHLGKIIMKVRKELREP